MNDISMVLQNLLKCFNGTIISKYFGLSFPVYSVIFSLSLNEILLLLSEKKSIALLVPSKFGTSL